MQHPVQPQRDGCDAFRDLVDTEAIEGDDIELGAGWNAPAEGAGRVPAGASGGKELRAALRAVRDDANVHC